MALPNITAAEVFVLQNPNEDNSRKALRLLLKEATLRGLIRCTRNTRNLPTNLMFPIGFGLGIVCYLFLFQTFAGFLVGSLVGLVVGYFTPGPDRQSEDLLLIEPTEKGKKIPLKAAKDATPLDYILQRVIHLQNQRYQNCSFDELLAGIKTETPSGAEFLDHRILSHLVKKGLLNVKYNNQTALEARLRKKKEEIGQTVRSDGHSNPKTDALRHEYRRLRDMPCHHYTLTEKGKQTQQEIEKAIQTGHSIPRMMRESPQAAGALAFSLGAMILLIPDLEGRYGDLLQYINLHANDGPWQEPPREQPVTDGSSGGDGSSFSDDEKDLSPESNRDDFQDNGSDLWDSDSDSSDFFDGSMDSLDTGFTSDSADGSGGCGGDGGCSGGDGGGCGGCGGGGD